MELAIINNDCTQSEHHLGDSLSQFEFEAINRVHYTLAWDEPSPQAASESITNFTQGI